MNVLCRAVDHPWLISDADHVGGNEVHHGRAFSHGCMRVQDPVKYAEVLLSIVRPGKGYTQDRIRKMIASMGERDIQFPH